jgi:hypothetical protein
MAGGRGKQILYSFATISVTIATIYYAYSINHHFFPTMVYLWQSKVSF